MLDQQPMQEGLEQIINETIKQIAQQNSSTININKVENDHKLNTDLGFSSLDLAKLVAVLELKIGVDPFAKLVPITSIRTVSDLCNAYQKCFSIEKEQEQKQPSFPESQKRAEMRLHRRQMRNKDSKA